MTETDSRTQERNERLEALRSAVNDFVDAETERLERERDFLNSVLSGRTPSGQVASDNNSRTSVLAEEEINAFLAGE